MSEFNRQTHIELAACQIVWNSILDVVDIRNPVITADVADIKEIEAIQSYDYAFEMTPEIVWAPSIGWCPHKLITQSDIHPFV